MGYTVKNYSQKKRQRPICMNSHPSFHMFRGTHTIYWHNSTPHKRMTHLKKYRGFSLFTQKCCSHQGKKKGKWTARQIFTRRLGHQKRVEVSVYIFDNEGFWIQYKLGHLGIDIWGGMYVVSRVKSVWKYFYV